MKDDAANAENPAGTGAQAFTAAQIEGLRFAWCRIPSPVWDPVPYYHAAIELPDGRMYWRLMIIADMARTPGDWFEGLLRHPAMLKHLHFVGQPMWLPLQ